MKAKSQFVNPEEFRRLIAGGSNKGSRRIHKPGEMNRAEEKYAMELELRKRAGDIIWWGFEAVKLRLADKTFYTPDFCVMREGFVVEFHEVKGHWEDDARVKIKVAAEMFPFRFIATDGKGYHEEF